jgi:hypothetical protein
MARIDLDGDSGGDLNEALKQLEERQKRAAGRKETESAEAEATEDPQVARRRVQRQREAEHRQSRDDIQGAVEAIRERQEERKPRRKEAGPARWIVLGVVVAAVLGAAAFFLRPVPLPEPAYTPEGAVRGFWQEISEGRYQGATVFYPALVDKYGSRRQAAMYLEDRFASDPVTKVTVGVPEELPDTGDMRVSYEVWRRSGRPTTGEFIVRGAGPPANTYSIITGP